MRRPRLLPLAILVMAALFLVKAEALVGALSGRAVAAGPARAADPPPPHAPPPVRADRPSPPAATSPAAAPPLNPVDQAERALLEQLRARRTELDAREQAVAAQEVVLQAAETRIARRVEELTALQQRLEALERDRAEREDAGWRGLVRTYEAMRPRDAAAIFNELDMPVLVQILDRMAERKAAPVIGAMRPEKAREVTAQLARHRASRATLH